MFNRVLYADQRLYINGYELSGVFSLDGAFNLPYNKIKAVGINTTDSILSELTANLTAQRYIVSDDPIKTLTGDISFGGVLTYNNNTIGFRTGYMTNYKAEVTVGQIPTISNSFLIYGNFGSGISSATNSVPPDITITRPGSLALTLNESNSNRVQSFTYEVVTNRLPQYVMGSILPSQVFIDYPIEKNCTFSIEVDPNYETTELYKQLCNPDSQNISLSLQNCDKTSTIISYSLNSPKLIGFNIGSDINRNLIADYSYQELIN